MVPGNVVITLRGRYSAAGAAAGPSRSAGRSEVVMTTLLLTILPALWHPGLEGRR